MIIIIRKVVYGEDVSPLCRMCGTEDETMANIVSECPKLAQKEYKNLRHDNVAKVIHWKLCQKCREMVHASAGESN